MVDDFQNARVIANQISHFFIKRDEEHKPLKGWQIQALAQTNELYAAIFRDISKEDFNFSHSVEEWLFKILDEQTDENPLALFLRELGNTPINFDDVHIIDIASAWLLLHNPAYAFYADMLNPELELNKEIKAFKQLDFRALFSTFTAPKFAAKKDLYTFLQQPQIHGKQVISQQLEYMRHYWWNAISSKTRSNLLRNLKFIYEEQVEDHKRAHAPERVLKFAQGEFQKSRRQEAEWMQNLVLITKNCLVWLEQLGRKYGAAIRTLDQIPEEELVFLADAGISGLWLIGIWERSPASGKIKELYGFEDAIASAYSVNDYRIAENLGGEAAYLSLKEKAAKQNIRLAADMVPNHTGLDADWVIKHPEWYINTAEKPKDFFAFDSPELSPEPDVSIKLEQHYFAQTGAAEVFQHIDKRSQQTRYIYHGNDGTSMPWNDTAQLNYLRSEVREAVIKTILKIARKFPIIRFDAAMALTKQHYQRLWFPQPNTPDCVPTRDSFSMNKEEFDRAMPREFWLEVVERLEKETPYTLLMAEAFWLTEGFFIRELGMHRVYNSAFMNLLRDEQNDEYRQILKNVLASDAAILGRFVNFLNNPDERTAIDQFGKGDKYFGVCTLMACMPGLPLIGHGQFEGFAERYGMDFKKPFWDEQVDNELMNRHQKEIFPLLNQRSRFSDPLYFVLLDFTEQTGKTNENVIAFANKSDSRVSLIIFNNHFQDSKGSIKTSCPLIRKVGGLRNISIIDVLGITENVQKVVFYDPIRGFTIDQSVKDLKEHGLQLSLKPYQTITFLDIQIH